MPGRARGKMFDIRPEHGVEDSGTGAYPGYPGYGDSDIESYDEYDEHYAEFDARRDGRGAGGGPVPPGRPANGAARGDGAPGAAGRNGAGRNGSGHPDAPRDGAGRNGSGRGGAANGRATNGRAANGAGPRTGAGRVGGDPGATAATTAVRAVRGGTGRTPVPGPDRPDDRDDRDDRVAPDGRWDDDEPPLLSHRGESEEPAYARDRTPQGFDGGDPDAPDWGRPGRPAADEYEYDEAGDDDPDDSDPYDEDEYGVGDAPLSVPPPGSGGRPLGPADVEELDPSMTDALARVDLGAVHVPVPYGAELKLEPAGAERPQAVHLLLPEGRIAVSALAAPRSSGLWPDLSAEIEQSLRKGGARVRNARGDWGRELHARTENAASVFVGCDGPRWMVYGVATASLETVEALDVELRRVLRGIIVVRGKSPYPPRTVLPLELPEHLREAQPDVAPQKPSITVSVPRPAGETGSTRAPASGATPLPTTGATPAATTGATPRPAADEPVRRAPAAGPAPSAPARRPADADPATRALPQVPRRPAAAAGPAPAEAERTALSRPVPREEPGERTAIAPLTPAADAEAPAGRAGRRRGRPDRPDRSTGATRRGPAPGVRPEADEPVRRPAADEPVRRPAADEPVRRPAADEPVRRPAADLAGPAGTGAYARPAAGVPDPLDARTPLPAAEPERAPAPEPPVRRDPAVTTLSVADLLAGTEADPALGAGPATGDRTAETRRPARRTRREERSASGDGDVPAPAPARRRRSADRDAADRVDAADLLAARDTGSPAAGPGRSTAERLSSAIEDIPLSDIPLMEATLDREPEPEPLPEPVPEPQPRSAAEPLPRRTRRRGAPADTVPGAGTGSGTADDWLSSEIAASRRAGRHGGGRGTSVADLLASSGLDGHGGHRRADAGDTGRPSASAAHAEPAALAEPAGPAGSSWPAGDDDLFRSPSVADGVPGRGYLEGGPTSADEARSALQDLLRSASGAPDDDGTGVTGLADYRASRAAAGRRNGRDRHGDDADHADGPDDAEPGRRAAAGDGTGDLPGDPGRAAGGTGLTGRWPAGRRAAGTDPRDLGRHRRD
ncbi:DUF3710 domain-containing protein [Pseudonocardia sp. EC080625-04]|uniref:DUF3710 domain-containing protein n=1 Tax=Pseudonocardia sp. EC080625-04 TaxID=1096868 RepID=UPI0007613D3B|nr:DUF3710 domain-containing protein [Pseudonocardia sp. EC080625-04]